MFFNEEKRNELKTSWISTREDLNYYVKTVPKFNEYMNMSKASHYFFDSFDVLEEEKENAMNQMIDLYELELKHIIKNVGNDNFSDDMKILNFLEFNRLNGMYENIIVDDNSREESWGGSSAKSKSI